MKNILFLAILIFGCSRFEYKGKRNISFCGPVDAKLDKWTGEIKYNINNEWYSKKEFKKTDIYMRYKNCLSSIPKFNELPNIERLIKIHSAKIECGKCY